MAKFKKNFGTKPFTTMFNDHFVDKRLSWGAVGMLSNVMSLPDTWEFSVKGFAKMHSDGERVVRSLLYELEWFGYLRRIQIRDTKGHFVDYIYEFCNESQDPDKKDPVPKWSDRKELAVKHVQIVDLETGEVVSEFTEDPHLQNVVTGENEHLPRLQNVDAGFVDVENADAENAHADIVAQLNTKELKKENINPVINQSINQSKADDDFSCGEQPQCGSLAVDDNLVARVKEQIGYEQAVDDYPLNKETIDCVVDCVAQLSAASQPMTFNRVSYQPDIIRTRASLFSPEHVAYVVDSFLAQTRQIHNVRSYLMTAVFNAPATHGAHEDHEFSSYTNDRLGASSKDLGLL